MKSSLGWEALMKRTLTWNIEPLVRLQIEDIYQAHIL